MKTGFDLSNYDGDVTAAIPALKSAGLQFAVVGCQQPNIAAAQVKALQAASVPVIGTYAFMYWGLNTTGQTQAAVTIAKANDIPYVFLDCEAQQPDEAAGQTPRTRTDQLRACVTQVQQAGLKPGIYTGAYYWPNQMGNSTEWAHLPLWHASYYTDRHYQPTVAYGGWTDVAIHQYASQPAVAGQNRDYDVLFDWFEQQLGGGDMATVDIMQLARCIARGANDPQTNKPVDTSDDDAVERTIAALDMGGLGLANAIQSAQMDTAIAGGRLQLAGLALGDNWTKLRDAAQKAGLIS